MLDLNLHSAAGINIAADGNIIIGGKTQQGNEPDDTTNRMFFLSTKLEDITDTSPKITVPKQLFHTPI